MTPLTKLIMAVIVSGAGLTLVLVALNTVGSVLWSFEEEGDPLGEPSFVVLNPLREREPERLADSTLRSLRAREFDQVVSAVGLGSTEAEELIERERRLPLESWRLAGRRDEIGRIRLFYRVTRGVPPQPGSYLWITVQRKEEGGWRVSDLEGAY